MNMRNKLTTNLILATVALASMGCNDADVAYSDAMTTQLTDARILMKEIFTYAFAIGGAIVVVGICVWLVVFLFGSLNNWGISLFTVGRKQESRVVVYGNGRRAYDAGTQKRLPAGEEREILHRQAKVNVGGFVRYHDDDKEVW